MSTRPTGPLPLQEYQATNTVTANPHRDCNPAPPHRDPPGKPPSGPPRRVRQSPDTDAPLVRGDISAESAGTADSATASEKRMCRPSDTAAYSESVCSAPWSRENNRIEQEAKPQSER
jgi:hypothetical protein